ncbi:MAG: C4-type zinc ribbon domain-containing protein [Deltaproteobacteria bacterium]|nr:C4-type zinc ribbon domain-containing protein [Deltaproteobacteria bacterium]MCW8892464.1 C4-type zinc ribbon domain-containing protein [Deltaproteobacteria bacterium]MCW9048786.1 C4-type zinc ribbon domain-containing protein [Deltaproteobacteria bacterium]
MQNKLNLLKDLQEIDQEISSIEVTRQGYLSELAAFEADAARVQEMLDQLMDEVSLLQQSEAQLQQDLLKERDNVARVEARLPGIQTQKEYVAVLKEIDVAKKANKEIEDQVQEKLQEIAALEEDRQEKESEMAAILENSEARGTELNVLLAESEAVLLKRTQTREAVAEELPASLLRKYHTLFKRRGGLALAQARNGACLGCNMQLPPQQYNKLLRVKELQTCPHCNRILYVEQEA